MAPQTLLVGRYWLDRPIGSGGMGQVWAAHDTVLGRDVAVKVQRFDRDGDRAAFDRFVREARAAAALQHPNVVTIFDSGTDADTAFLVMELLPGPTLDEYVAQLGPLPKREAVALAAQVASGLVAAHGVGVVHRDIKPANLMFDARGTLKIVDFGIAYLAQSAAVRLTATNTVIGSLPYLSPEQLRGGRADERSDLYALGCVMTTMLTGRPPFEGEHPLAYIHQHVNAAPPRIRDRRPDLDPALDALVAQLLSKSPHDRPQSALEVLERLTHPQPDSLTSETRGATTVIRGQSTRPTPTQAIPTALPAMRERRRPSGRWFAAGAALLLTLMAAVVIAAVMAEAPLGNEAAPRQSAPASAAPSRQPATTSSPEPPSPSVPESPGPSRESATRSATPSADPSSTARSLQQALSDLRAAVRAVSSSGEIEAKKAEELNKRVDELAKHLNEKRGEDAAKKVEDLDKYLTELAEKDELSPAGEQQISQALQAIRALVANG